MKLKRPWPAFLKRFGKILKHCISWTEPGQIPLFDLLDDRSSRAKHAVHKFAKFKTCRRESLKNDFCSIFQTSIF